MAKVNGRWRFSHPWGAETPETIKIQFGKIHCIGQGTPHAKIGFSPVGVWARHSGEVVRSRVVFSSFVTCTEKTAQSTDTLNIPKHVSRACADS